MDPLDSQARRRFLQFLLASPLAAASARAWAVGAEPSTDPVLLQSAADAVDVFDFEAMARLRIGGTSPPVSTAMPRCRPIATRWRSTRCACAAWST